MFLTREFLQIRRKVKPDWKEDLANAQLWLDMIILPSQQKPEQTDESRGNVAHTTNLLNVMDNPQH